jgi:uncharacterized OsmC-like protein
MNQPTPLPDVRQKQAPLRARYRESAESAWIVDRADCDAADLADPVHGTVRFGTASVARLNYAVHEALGGPHDAPTPGDLLCAALASCQESSLRMVAHAYGVELTRLQVQVHAGADVRGTLGMDRQVPVGFQTMRVQVQLEAAPGTDAARLRRMLLAAERACVVLHTLRSGVAVELDTSGARTPAI